MVTVPTMDPEAYGYKEIIIFLYLKERECSILHRK